MMDIVDGRIIDSADVDELSYEIEQITASFEEDINDVIGVVRCTGIEIESEAPPELNAKRCSITSSQILNTMMRMVAEVTWKKP